MNLQLEDDLRDAVEQFLLLRLRGDDVTVDEYLLRFPALGQQLESRLRQAELVATAKSESCCVAASILSDEHRDATSTSPSDSHSKLKIRCPHCQQLVALATDTVWVAVTCSHCHGEFSLVDRADHNVAPLSEVGHFELLDRIGLGAFGTVWRARDRQLNRSVALKMPRKGELTERETNMFMREAQAAAQVLHPNVVRIYEVGHQDDVLYIASELIEGKTLSEALASDRPTARDSARLAKQIADGLHAAHEAGVVHRDLKPGNVLLSADDQPHITDFGLAKHDATDVLITLDGALVGTPAYMAPEQAGGTAHTADARSDVYSLGVILFQLLTGELPFRGSATTMIQQVLHDEPPRLRQLNQTVPRDLETICLKCLEKNPDSRFQSAAELSEELQRFLEHLPIRTRPVGNLARLWRWSQRRPAVAALSVAVISSLTLGLIASTMFARQARHSAAQHKASASELTQTVDELKSAAYAYEMTEVQRAVESENYENAMIRLQKYAADTDDAHHRGPEWHYWYRQIHRRQLALWDGKIRIRGLAVSRDQSRLAWGDASGQLFLANASLSNVRQLPTKLPAQAYMQKFSPDGTRLYSLCFDGTLSVTDIEQDATIGITNIQGVEAIAMAIFKDGKRLVASAQTGELESHVLLLDATSLELLEKFKVPEPIIDTISIYPSQDRALLAGRLGMYVLDLARGVISPFEVLQQTGFGAATPITDASQCLITIHEYLTGHTVVALVDVSTNKILRYLDRPENGIGCGLFRMSPEFHSATAPVVNQTVEVYDLETGELTDVLRGHRNRVTGAEFVDGNRRIVSTSDDGTVRLWALDSELDAPTSRKFDLAPRRKNAVAFSGGMALAPNGREVAILSPHQISVLDVATDSLVHTYQLPEDLERFSIAQLAYTPQGHLVALFHQSRIILFDKRRTVAFDKSFDETTDCFALSPDGKQYLLGVRENRSKTWKKWPGLPCRIEVRSLEDPDFKQVWQPDDSEDIWRPHRMTINALATSAEDNRLYSISRRDRSLKAWDATSGELIYSYRRPNNVFGPYRALAISPDASIVAVGWSDHLITLFDHDGNPIQTLVGHEGVVTDLAFSGDGRTLISSSTDMTIRLWDVALGELRSTLRGHTAPVCDLEMTPDSQWIVSLDVEGNLIRWDCRQDDASHSQPIENQTR